MLLDNLSLSPFVHTEICHADTNLRRRLTHIYTHTCSRAVWWKPFFIWSFRREWGLKTSGETKLDLGRGNNSRDLKCLVGMISLNHLITYITTAACSAVCQFVCVRVCVSVRTCACFQFISVCISICVCRCSGKQTLEELRLAGGVCVESLVIKDVPVNGRADLRLVRVHAASPEEQHAAHPRSSLLSEKWQRCSRRKAKKRKHQMLHCSKQLYYNLRYGPKKTPNAGYQISLCVRNNAV